MKIDKIVVGPIRTNCYILSSEKNNAILIDPGDEPNKLIEFIKSQELDLKYIFITHGHFDHVMALENLQEKYPKAKVFISEKDAELLEKLDEQLKFIGLDSRSGGDDKWEEGLGIYNSLEENSLVEIDDIEIKSIETPGHTKGGMTFQVNNKYLFKGDTLFKNNIGRTDLYGGDIQVMKSSLKKLIKLDDNLVVYPGHGESSLLGEEKKWLAQNVF